MLRSRGERASTWLLRTDGVVELEGTILVELEDVAKGYRHPSIVDIKVGFKTWYPGAEPRYVERCKLKDAATTQAALGFKICGMQARPSMCVRHRGLHTLMPAVIHLLFPIS